MLKINEELLIQDYESAKKERATIVANAINEVSKITLNLSQERKEVIVQILVNEFSVDIDKKLAFFEKYIEYKEDIIDNGLLENTI